MSVAEEIKARLDLVAYIGESVSLKKAGRTYKARCPFHQERTPSFVVFPETQTWRCFGACGEGGDIFAFAMKQHGWDFQEALSQLAERAGVELKPRTLEQDAQQAAFERLLGLLDETAHFFHHQLLEAPPAAEARDYVERRSLQPETVEAFLLGYAPDGWQTTLDHLVDLGYTVEDAIAAGVAIRNDRGRVYDRFRHRLVIPIRDGRGRVIGFGARALRDEDHPKYLNSPQSDLFDKSHTLYGLDMARREIRETETAVIVEGYMDVMQAHQAGFRNVVAQMGTALTEPQLQALRKYADRLILALDPDQAGIQATMRGLDVARSKLSDKSGPALFGHDGQTMRTASQLNIDLAVLELPTGYDPDDLIREKPEKWQQLVTKAIPLADFIINNCAKEINPKEASIEQKIKIARNVMPYLLPLLKNIEGDLVRQKDIQRLALKLYLPERHLAEIALEYRKAASPRRPTNPHFRQKRRTPAMDQALTQWLKPQPPAARPPQPQWEEGPRPDYDEIVPPPEDDFEADIGLGEAPPARPARPQFNPTQKQEAYCLAVLLYRPELLYKVNRAMREAAETTADKVQDGRWESLIRRALTPLSADDFVDPVHQAIALALQQSLDQDRLDPLQFVREAIGETLHEALDAVLALHQPLTALEEALPAPLRPELPSVQKQQRKQGRLVADPADELVDKTLVLRKERLRRINEELRFLLMEAEAAEKQTYDDIIDANDRAILELDRILAQRSQLFNG